ncbi:AAA family ATPase [Nocardia vulneris]|uniref:ATPase AAA-type core domain-containing protein n=1 Tax=Nocardia vulneris TaxID=1141657 RepID=A0ABR4Z5Q5_9NOCA|nr:AAA family ATPase [Nocardia vulneris]KIA60379.1 hypothetical protein FG87_37185 [Nocardia vulneris]
MRLKELQAAEFKRFSHLTVTDIPETARLIVLAGPNGVGKSSFFDALRTWHWQHGSVGFSWDETYYVKAQEFEDLANSEVRNKAQNVQLTMHDEFRSGIDDARKRVYVRSAFRSEPDFNVSSFSRPQSPLETVRVNRLIDTDASISENYRRLIIKTIDGVFDDEISDATTKAEIRSRIIGRVADSMLRVFPDLVLTGVGDPMDQGSFYFQKGKAKKFLYKNVSAGEKAVFDLLLDMIIKREYFDDTLWCIDEPEVHLNTRIQGKLLGELLTQLPERSQLVIATHSIGFMAKARELEQDRPGEVVFLDFDRQDFDRPVVLRPIVLDRDFWARTLDVALGDLAPLVAPEQIVLCEGRPIKQGELSTKAEFDAKCYRAIFGKSYPDTDFISVGNSDDVSRDKLELGRSIQAIISGTKVIRVVDRDYMNDADVEEYETRGVNVLSRRNVESYLLDDEMITALCVHANRPELGPQAVAIKNEEVSKSVQRGNDSDDLKSPAGSIYIRLKKLLQIDRPGRTWESFCTQTLAPLMTKGMSVYKELEDSIFKSRS